VSGPAKTQGGRASAPSLAGAFQHQELVLPNGLRVILIPRPALHRTSIALHLRVGSRYETSESNGISHFLEHMLYRGTKSLPTAHDQALAFERLGGTLYAATATDHGVMSISLPTETACEAAVLLGEVAQHPRFSSIDVERRIVEEEILEDLDDDGRQIDADNLSRELLYRDHPLGFTITGSADHVRAFDEPALAAHHARHYGARNAVLSIAGAYDERALLQAIEQGFASMPPGVVAGVTPPPALGKKARFRYVESDGSQTDLRVAFRGPGDHAPLEPAVEVLLRVVDDGMSTRLYERLCDAKGLCYDVSGAFETFEDEGVFDFAAETRHARTAEVLGEILAICAELAEHGPTDAELDKVRARSRWGTRSMLDDPDDLAGFYGLACLARVASTPDVRCEQLLAVTRAQVVAAAKELFTPERLAVVAVGVLTRSEQRAVERVIKGFGALAGSSVSRRPAAHPPGNASSSKRGSSSPAGPAR
jgi:predicted Zn-dependent peptidase